MEHKTTEYQLAEMLCEQQKRTAVPTAYALLGKNQEHTVNALSVDGMVRLAKQVANQFDVIVYSVGSSAGCYSCSEGEALGKYRKMVETNQ